jgi:glutathione peroxidase
VVTITSYAVTTIDGTKTTLDDYAGKALLIVNVASKCGLTPQYTALEQLQKEYADRGFSVLGFPCNQFKGQEPGTNEEIAEFCSATYGVTFPLFDKIDVNGANTDPLYLELKKTAVAPDPAARVFPGEKEDPNDISWNFEKFLISPAGDVVARFGPATVPDDPTVISAIEAQLPA